MDWVQELLNRKRMMQGNNMQQPVAAGNGMAAMQPGMNGQAAMTPQPWANGPQALTPPGNPVDVAAAGVSDMQPQGGGMGMNPMLMGANMWLGQQQDKQRQQEIAQQQATAASQGGIQQMQQMAALMRQRMGMR